MARKQTKREPTAQEIRAANWRAASEARRLLSDGPLSRVWEKAKLEEARGIDPVPAFGTVDAVQGIVYVNTMAQRGKRTLNTEEWMAIVGHLVLHLTLDHAARRENRDPLLWNAACDLVADRILLSLGSLRTELLLTPADLPGTEEEVYDLLTESKNIGTIRTWAGDGRPDMLNLGRWHAPNPEWELRLAQGIREAATDAVERAADSLLDESERLGKVSPKIARARRWVLHNLPLLGAIAEQVKIIESREVCERMGISIAAVCGYLGEMYLNPAVNFTYEEWLFVYVHELLHVALLHHSRTGGRDPEVYNWACDFVINAWLVEMGIGQMPKLGLLYDPELAGKTSEEIYDLLMENQSRRKKLRGFAGNRGDVLLDQPGRKIFRDDVSTLDDMWRRCLKAGVALHGTGRGTVPLALLEEIQSLFTPPVPWDVELARWMDLHVPLPRDWRRTYARASRRQASTPDIPRPARYIPQETLDACTFGVVMDTSGSMDRQLLGRALGAIASYSEARDVPAVRLVLCDAQPYDRGYVQPTDLRGTYPVTGRGGTVLQPALSFLLGRGDFPASAPIMVITDGFCEEEITCPREHCFLLPRKSDTDKWRSLRTSAPIFRVLKEDFE
jgi:predicted metal-dependent peptidase